MLFPGSLPWLQSKVGRFLSRCSQAWTKWILAPLAAHFQRPQRQAAPLRNLAVLLLFHRFATARTLNEADAALAVMSALLDHCENNSAVELDDAVCRDLRWILGKSQDVSILCGHVRVLINDKNSQHADKVVKLLKRIVMS